MRNWRSAPALPRLAIRGVRPAKQPQHGHAVARDEPRPQPSVAPDMRKRGIQLLFTLRSLLRQLHENFPRAKAVLARQRHPPLLEQLQ